MERQGGIYVRYSPGRDSDQTSTIEAQVAICREKAGSPNPLPFPTLPKTPRHPHLPDGAPPSTRFPRNTKSRRQGTD